MIDRAITIAGAALIFTVAAAPAFAGNVPRLPEPTTMTLFGLGLGGAYLAKRFIGRK